MKTSDVDDGEVVCTFVQYVSTMKGNFNHMFLRVKFLFSFFLHLSFSLLVVVWVWDSDEKVETKIKMRRKSRNEWRVTDVCKYMQRKSKTSTADRIPCESVCARCDPNRQNKPHCCNREKLWHSDVRNRFFVIRFFVAPSLSRSLASISPLFDVVHVIVMASVGSQCECVCNNFLCAKHIFLFRKVFRTEYVNVCECVCFGRWSFAGCWMASAFLAVSKGRPFATSMCSWALWHQVHTHSHLPKTSSASVNFSIFRFSARSQCLPVYFDSNDTKFAGCDGMRVY